MNGKQSHFRRSQLRGDDPAEVERETRLDEVARYEQDVFDAQHHAGIGFEDEEPSADPSRPMGGLSGGSGLRRRPPRPA